MTDISSSLLTVVYTTEEPPESYTKSIFAAGPTPRGNTGTGWRNALIAELEQQGYDGVLFIPEPRDGDFPENYDDQIEWETKHLNLADIILFWIPRDLATMPAFTTNVEYGTWLSSGKVVLGAPPEAPKNTYLISLAHTNNVPYSTTLHGTVQNALALLSDGAVRTAGERYVPLHIWRTPSFQKWYTAQTRAGNILHRATVTATYPQYRYDNLFLWGLHVDMWIQAENRHKTNEIVLSRPHTVSVLAYHPKTNIAETEIVLVKEYRPAAATPDGYIWELPGGSSYPFLLQTDKETAQSELAAETGVTVGEGRLLPYGSRQLAPTLTAHHTALFLVELDDREIATAKQAIGTVHGEYDGERCHLQVVTLQDILDGATPVDWGTRGMILSLYARLT